MTIDEDLIRAIGHSTMVVHGRDDDRIISLGNSLRLLQLIERAQLHVFGRSGHWVQIEHADAFNRLVGTSSAEATTRNGALSAIFARVAQGRE
ncbi:MAG: alpha/beta fold hydrolase [Haloechinothrix sp.]